MLIKSVQATAESFPGTAVSDSVLVADNGTKIYIGVGSVPAMTMASDAVTLGTSVGINMAPGSGYALDVTGQVRSSGDITAFSDRRFKENVVRIPGALAKVEKLSGYTFTRNDVPDADKHVRRMGVIAQEVLEVAPEAVHGDAGSGLSVAYGNLVGLLIEAVKELSCRVKELEAASAAH